MAHDTSGVSTSSSPAFMWFALGWRFLPLIDEGASPPDAAAYAEAAHLTDTLRACRRDLVAPPPSVLRWLTEEDLWAIGLRRRDTARC